MRAAMPLHRTMLCDRVLFRQLRRRACDGSATGGELNQLALLYDTGRGCLQSDGKAFRYMLAAADGGSLLAMATVATVYQTCGAPRRARAWWTKAAGRALPEAQRKVAEYAVAEDDVDSAIFWYTASSRNGDQTASRWLATHYLGGTGNGRKLWPA